MKIITRAVLEWDEDLGRYVTVEEDSFEYDGPVAECRKPKAPAAPDPNVVATAQNAQNRDAALWNATLNRVNQYGPQGSSEYQVTGVDPRTGAPIYSQTTSLSPELQRMWQGAINNYSTPFSFSGIDDLRNRTEQAMYDRNAAYLDPQFARDENQMRTRLANQGVVEGSEAFSNAYDDFSRSKEMAYRQARDSSIIGAGSEADRGLNQALMMRNMPASELNAMMSVGTPSFQGAPQVGINPADIAGAMGQQYQGQLAGFNAKNESRNALISGLFGLAGAGILASDERVKEDIEKVGELDSGDNLYAFRYKGDPTPQVGVMAQEVEKIDPKAIHTRSGIKHVDYARVLARALEAA